MEDWPSALADALGTNVGTAQVILSISVIFMFLLPVMLLAKGKNATLLYLIITLLTECLLVGLGWMPFWILIATIVLMSFGVATLGSKILGDD